MEIPVPVAGSWVRQGARSTPKIRHKTAAIRLFVTHPDGEGGVSTAIDQGWARAAHRGGVLYPDSTEWDSYSIDLFGTPLVLRGLGLDDVTPATFSARVQAESGELAEEKEEVVFHPPKAPGEIAAVSLDLLVDNPRPAVVASLLLHVTDGGTMLVGLTAWIRASTH
jgi:hypothetical protein